MRLERQMPRARPRPRVMQFVNSLHLGGTEGQVVELLRGLAEGFEMRAAVIHAEGPHLTSVRRLGIEPLAVPLAGSLARPETPRQIARLVGVLRRERVELVHAHDFYTALLAVPAARLAGTRAIVGRLDLAHWLNVPQRVALAAATRSAHHVVANAEAIKRAIVETERLPAERVSVVHNGIDLARFDSDLGGPLAGPLPPLEGRTVIVHVANMTHPVKAQEVLFEALRALRARRPEVLLLLAGDGPRRAGLEELAAAMGLAGAVCFLGRRSDVPAILARGDIGVLCSSAEGLSNAIIEGMAASLPMVVTDAGGNGELVRDEENGFVVPIGSSTMLASRLEMLARARPLRTKMGQAGRAFVEHELRLERLLERHEALYRKVLSEG